jgi:hypothetical protein
MSAGSHYSKTYECGECGYSRFHLASEFASSELPGKTRICADCGHAEGKQQIGQGHDLHAEAATYYVCTSTGDEAICSTLTGAENTAENALYCGSEWAAVMDGDEIVCTFTNPAGPIYRLTGQEARDAAVRTQA